MSAETPDLFPGLTAADRAKLAELAGNMEALPALVERLNGYLDGLSKARAETPGLVVPGTGLNSPLNELVPTPLATDSAARVWTRSARSISHIFPVRIPAGATTAVFRIRPGDLTLGDNITPGSFTILALDDLARPAGEVISLDVGPNVGALYQGIATVFGATPGIAVGISATFILVPVWRLRSSVAVAADRNFTIIFGSL